MLRTHPNSRQRGFTLIEVTVVIVIILILTSVAIGVYGPFRQRQASSRGMDKLAVAMGKARSAAMADGFSFRVTIVQDDRSFWIDRTGNTAAEQMAFDLRGQKSIDPVTGDEIQVGLPKVVRPETLPEGVIFSEIRNAVTNTVAGITYSYIIFQPDGSCVNSPSLELISTGASLTVPANYNSIQVIGPSGAVRKLPLQPLP